jgi:hypothetical protein
MLFGFRVVEWRRNCTMYGPRRKLMPIAKITGQGLAAVAASVALLWTCILADRAAEQMAVNERARVVREVQQMQQRLRPEPASTPSPFSRHRLQMNAG